MRGILPCYARQCISLTLPIAHLVQHFTPRDCQFSARFRRRIDKVPELGAPQLKPKRLRLCFDVSGSMYRFNGYDKRLQKSLEAALMVMTSFEGKQEKVAVG